MGKSNGNISNWMKQSPSGELAHFLTLKQEDLERLRKSGLPQFEGFDVSYVDFTSSNKDLMAFFGRQQGVCLRVVPTEMGLRQGLIRHHKYGRLSFEYCADFAAAHVADSSPELWDIRLSAWAPNRYGFVLMAGNRYIRGEIAKNLERLSHGQETPLASFLIDLGKIGHITDKTSWLEIPGVDKSKSDEAASFLWRAFDFIRMPRQNFDPIYHRGYFEGVVTRRKEDNIRFLDYKTNKAYLA